jgi:methylated-DNA-[protein]-cysteine S-methyltransferase
MIYDTIPSPVGPITLVADGTHLTGVHLTGDRYFNPAFEAWKHVPSAAVIRRAAKQLQEYFGGKRDLFAVDVSTGGTDFQRQVWQAVSAIPYGATRTYAQIAASIGRPKAVRAVGTAIGKNPACLVIPCHRVLASDGSLGGYVAGLERKQWLLAHEEKARQNSAAI